MTNSRNRPKYQKEVHGSHANSTTCKAATVAVDVSTDRTTFTTFTNILGQTGSSVNRYQSSTCDFTATLATTPFILRGSTTTNGFAIQLDNASVTTVGGAVAAPEPATLALLGLSITPIAILVARRVRNV